MIDRLIVTVEMVAYICYGVQPIGSLPTYTYGVTTCWREKIIPG